MDNKKNNSSVQKNKKKKNSPWKWIVTIFLVTIIISAGFSFFSGVILSNSNLVAALVVLLIIVMVGIIFDIVGVAVTAVDEKAIHGMVSRKIPGAAEASWLVNNANRVSSICNDVIGDVCGVVSGSATAAIASRIIVQINCSGVLADYILPLSLSAMVAGLTVGGKAIGKIAAMGNSTQIVFKVGRVLSFFSGGSGNKKGKKNKRK